MLASTAFSQPPKKQLAAKRITSNIKIDGVLDDAAWKEASKADKFIESRPVSLRTESADNASEVYIAYNNEGIFVGGYFHEKQKTAFLPN